MEFFQQVDVRTMLIVSVVLGAVMALCLGFGLRRHRERIGPAATLWVLGTALQPLGFIMLVQRGQWPGFLTNVIANVVLLAGYLAYLAALRRFTAQSPCTALSWWLVGLMFAVTLLFGEIVPDYRARAVAGSPILAAAFGLCAWTLWRGAARPFSASHTITLLTFAVGATLMLLRAASAAILDTPLAGLTDPAPLQVLVVGYAGLMPVLASFGFLLLCNDRSQAELERLAATDPLTGVFNRRVLEQLVNAQLADARRHPRPLSLLLIDADHFKAINDEHGHGAGDQALRALVDAVRPQLRPGDLIGRLGGEEFLIVLGATPAGEALLVAERLRGAVAARPLLVQDGAQIGLSVSVGVATQHDGETGDFAALVRRADAAMYEAKHAGRNCVRAATWSGAWPTPAAGLSTSLH